MGALPADGGASGSAVALLITNRISYERKKNRETKDCVHISVDLPPALTAKRLLHFCKARVCRTCLFVDYRVSIFFLHSSIQRHTSLYIKRNFLSTLCFFFWRHCTHPKCNTRISDAFHVNAWLNTVYAMHTPYERRRSSRDRIFPSNLQRRECYCKNERETVTEIGSIVLHNNSA